MIDLKADEILTLCKARDILESKLTRQVSSDDYRLAAARAAVIDVLAHVVSVPKP